MSGWLRGWSPRGGKRVSQLRGGYSLRRRLIACILGASVLVWLIGLAMIVSAAWDETSEVFDDALEEGAGLVLALGDDLHRHGLQPVAAGKGPEPAKLNLYYQIVAPDGRILHRAERAPAEPFSRGTDKRTGFLDVRVAGKLWRVYVLHPEGQEFQVQIGQPWDERLELLEDMAEDLAWPALLLMVLLGAFCWFVIHWLLRPIERTAGRIAAKSSDDLSEVPTAQEPRELQPIILAFNTVLGRLDDALQAERRFTADAAHQLRTPLAALRMRIQLMQRQGTAAGRGSAADLGLLRDEVDRCTALLESLLVLTRLDPERPESLVKERVDLDTLFKSVRTGEAQDRRIEVEADCRAATILANPVLLQSALCTLLDNAARYCPRGSRVVMQALPIEAGVRIAVRDDGPGVAAADRARLGKRFFRVLGTAEQGSGLGLSIVARIAALHRASLRFEAGLGGRGLGVVLDFPSG